MANPTPRDDQEAAAVCSFPAMAFCSDNECVLGSSLEDQETTGTSLIDNWIDS
jgi:hypothetical protein